MGQTFAEKIIERKSGAKVQPGECAIVDVDVMMASDTTGPLAIKAFREMGGQLLAKKDCTVLILDHATPCPNEKIASLHALLREFAKEQGCRFFEQNYGVCHQIMLENRLVKQGDIVLGADSHTCSYGAVGAFSTGVGSTDLGASMLTGKTWLRVPESVKIELTGELPKGVSAKDVILTIIGKVKSDGMTYKAVEYTGSGFERFSQEEAITVCNMTIEMGGKNGVFVPALKGSDLMPDSDAAYEKELIFKAEEICPVVACPHTVDNVEPAVEMGDTHIDLVYIGSCTNGRLSDIEAAAKLLKGRRVKDGTRLIVSPASSLVMSEAAKRGYISDLIEAGAYIAGPGCGLCVGTLGGVPSDGETVLSTTNRNFKGRMGNNKAMIYLSSALTAAAAALTGSITDPREVI